MCTEKECTIKELKHQFLNGLLKKNENSVANFRIAPKNSNFQRDSQLRQPHVKFVFIFLFVIKLLKLVSRTSDSALKLVRNYRQHEETRKVGK